MLNRRTPMKRTPFKRASTTTHESEQEREQRLIDKARRAMNSVVPRAANMGSATTAAAPIPKAAPVRSEALRRAVASLPCINCGVPGLQPGRAWVGWQRDGAQAHAIQA